MLPRNDTPQPKDALRKNRGCGKLVSQHGFAPILKRSPQKQAGGLSKQNTRFPATYHAKPGSHFCALNTSCGVY